jgi:endonuclease-3 related protein
MLMDIYHRLWNAYGAQGWWPADGPLEVMIGAVLTQNTGWRGVEKAIANLKRHSLLSVEGLHTTPPDRLARLIQPAGYFNLKSRRLKNLIDLLVATYGGDLQTMAGVDTPRLRQQLLTVNGVGPETADSILLYAFHRPVFVVDAYTHRVLIRHGLIQERAGYRQVQELFTTHLPLETRLFNEYHALLVRVGKLHCRSRPCCRGCPLEVLLPPGDRG